MVVIQCLHAALCVDRNQPQVLWLPFQNAAGTITSLYKGKEPYNHLNFVNTKHRQHLCCVVLCISLH